MRPYPYDDLDKFAKEVVATDRFIACTVDAIARQVTALLRRTDRYARVAPDNVIESLIYEVFQNHPEAVRWLDRQPGEMSMRLAEALKDWLDLPEDR
jgi:hypothetical protein